MHISVAGWKTRVQTYIRTQSWVASRESPSVAKRLSRELIGWPEHVRGSDDKRIYSEKLSCVFDHQRNRVPWFMDNRQHC
jgi:hypothetical protein